MNVPLLYKKGDKMCINNINGIYKKTIDLINEKIDLGIIPTAKYSQKQHLKVLLSAAADNTSAESISDENPYLPSADTVLGNLGQQEWKIIKKDFDNVIGETIKLVDHQRWFRKKVVVAIDFHDDLYYGKADTEGIIGIKSERGTSCAFRIATIEIVEQGKRFTLAALPVVKGMEKEDIVEYLINEAKKYVKIKCVLMDRGFYDVQVAKIVDKLSVKFIIFSKVYKNLKKILNSIGERDITMSRVVGTKYTDFVEVNFLSHYNKSRKMRFSYITNICLTPKEAFNLYRKRWGIETGYRVKGDFKANTTSKSYVVRITYLMISICIYNIWVLINLIADSNVIKRFERITSNRKYKPSITTRKVKKACLRLVLDDIAYGI